MAVFLVPRAQLFISENHVHINRKQWVSKGCVVLVDVRGGEEYSGEGHGTKGLPIFKLQRLECLQT